MLAPFRAGIVHGGRQPAVGALADALAPAAVGTPQMAADGAMPRARRYRPMGTNRASVAPVAPAVPSEGAVTPLAAVGAKGGTYRLRKQSRLGHPFKQIGCGAFGNAWKCYGAPAVGGDARLVAVKAQDRFNC